jgi:hypothetical protein
MKLPTQLDDLRGNSRTITVSHAGPTVRLTAIDRDPFDSDRDIEYVVADLSVALLRNALETENTGLIPVQKAPARRRWWKRGVR